MLLLSPSILFLLSPTLNSFLKLSSYDIRRESYSKDSTTYLFNSNIIYNIYINSLFFQEYYQSRFTAGGMPSLPNSVDQARYVCTSGNSSEIITLRLAFTSHPPRNGREVSRTARIRSLCVRSRKTSRGHTCVPLGVFPCLAPREEHYYPPDNGMDTLGQDSHVVEFADSIWVITTCARCSLGSTRRAISHFQR